MSELADLLDQYVAHHRAFGVPFEKAPPVSGAEVAEVEDLLGASISASVLELWRWSNGCAEVPLKRRVNQPPLFMNGMHFWSLKKSARKMIELMEPGGFSDLPAEDARLRGLVEPLPGLMIADCFETLEAVVSLRESDAGSVWLWMHYGLGCRRCFDSIEDFVRLQISFYEAGVVTGPDFPYEDAGYVQPEVPRGAEGLEAIDIPKPWLATWYPRAWIDADEADNNGR